MLIIDDCSTDKSVEEIEKYSKKDPRIKLFTIERHAGSPTEPRNRGIQNARGRYIAFLDSDDVWLPEKLEYQIALFKNQNTAIVYSNYEKITEAGERNGRVITAPKIVTYKKLLKSNYIGCLTAIYDTAKVGKLFFNDFRHEDYVLWLTILRGGYIAMNTNRTGALYRVRNNSLTFRKTPVLKWQWRIYRDFLGLSILQSAYYFCCYAIRAFLKYTK